MWVSWRGIAVGAAAFILSGAGLVAATLASSARGAPAPSAPSTVLLASTARDDVSIAAPLVDVSQLARAVTGTVASKRGRRLIIDGARMDGGTAVVLCGTHSIGVVGQRAPRPMAVPCGEQLLLP